MRQNLSRRTLIKRGLAASLLYTVSGIPRTVLARELKSSLLRADCIPLRKPAITAAALQWLPDRQVVSRRSIEGDLLIQLQAVVEQVGDSDLIVVGRPGDCSCNLEFGSLVALEYFVQQTECHLVIPTHNDSQFYVISPFGETTSILCGAGTVFPTDIGTIVINNESQHPSARAVHRNQEVDIRILYDTVGYDRQVVAAGAVETEAHTIVVTSPQTPKGQQVTTGTALYCPTGSTLTETNGIWNQAIVGVFHVADWRKRRSGKRQITTHRDIEIESET